MYRVTALIDHAGSVRHDVVEEEAVGGWEGGGGGGKGGSGLF